MPKRRRGSKKWRKHAQAMVGHGHKILDLTEGLDKQTVIADAGLCDKIERNVSRLGEAIIHIPDEIRRPYPEVDWARIRRVRNDVVHNYLGINYNLLWRMIQEDIPVLLPALREILDANKRPSDKE